MAHIPSWMMHEDSEHLELRSQPRIPLDTFRDLRIEIDTLLDLLRSDLKTGEASDEARACIGKGKAHRPYEFGVKVSLATTLHRSKGGQFIAHAQALPGNPYDGHTLAIVVPEIETQIGANLTRIVADRGYRGHNAPPEHRFKVYISGQRRRVTETIKRQLRRRSAVEPVIGHAKAEHRMGRNHLAGTEGDAANAVLAAAGYNFRRLLQWLALLLALIRAADSDPSRPPKRDDRAH